MGPGKSISYPLMSLKKGFLKIHFSNSACSVARTPTSFPPPQNSQKIRTNTHTNTQTNRESNFLPQTTRVLRTTKSIIFAAKLPKFSRKKIIFLNFFVIFFVENAEGESEKGEILVIFKLRYLQKKSPK